MPLPSDTYTPTTEEILRGFSAPAYKVEPRREGEGFAEWLSRLSVDSFHAQVQSEDAARRWLARHDAEVAAKAWDEGAAHVYSEGGKCSFARDGDLCPYNPYRARLSSGGEPRA